MDTDWDQTQDETPLTPENATGKESGVSPESVDSYTSNTVRESSQDVRDIQFAQAPTPSASTPTPPEPLADMSSDTSGNAERNQQGRAVVPSGVVTGDVQPQQTPPPNAADIPPMGGAPPQARKRIIQGIVILTFFLATGFLYRNGTVSQLVRTAYSPGDNQQEEKPLPRIGFAGLGQPVSQFPIATPTFTPTPTPDLRPRTLKIEKLNIDTGIEYVGLTETNHMDVPQDANNVAWYRYGPTPSGFGNAVLAGHLDTPSGRPAIFYQLNLLEIGDVIEVVSIGGIKSVFEVTGKDLLPYDEFPSDYVFNSKSGKNLNLITCGGVWNQAERNYNKRLVVYSEYRADLSI